MPSVSVANFENEELLSARLLSFMAGSDQSSADSNGYTSSTSFASTVCPLTDSEVNGSTLCSPLHRNGSTPAITTLQDRITNGYPTDVSSSTVGLSANSPGFISGSCTPPPTASTSISLPPVRNLQSGAPPYSALTSPCVNSKLNSGANIHQLLPYGGAANECHSLQNSPFYNHYPLNGNVQTQLHRQLGGISPGPVSSLLPSGIQNLGGRNGICQDTTYTLNLRPTTTTGSGCPQRELFPNASSLSQSSGVSQNIFGSGLLMQDRLHYYALAQKYGFIVGPELERVKENSCRSTSQSYGRIAAHFRHRYGETEAKTKAAYLQIGVRVPSKDHVSEIVGKGGQKIKLIREETGALITTPGEHEEHVFIIEAPPEIAMRVAHHLSTRAQEITQSKLAAGERRRGSTSSQTNGSLDNGSVSNFTGSSSCTGSFSSNGGNGFLIPNGCAAPSSGILSLSSSATNSPLHPANGTLSASLMSSGGSSSMRTTNGNLFPNHLSSLPASPCNNGAGGINGQGQNGLSNGGSMFLGNTTPGSRILLARGRISVPQEMVGKIIGTQGSIITTIQKDTGTEIKSPPKEAARGPNATSEFEISAYQGLGLSSNQAAECRVQQAKQLIGHLVMRQLERRASEEVEDASGSSNLSSEANPPTPRTSCTWMWPDVAQMDSQEAREVLDRILAESKNKTRRAKELAAATTISAGPSPTSNSVSALATPGSMINMNGCHLSQASVLAQEPPSSQQQSQQQHFHPHLLNSGLFDQSDATTDCNDITHHQVSINDSSSIIPTSPFSPQTNHYINRQASTTLCDDASQNGTRGGRMYSPRALSGFNVPEANELLTTFPRVPAANLPSDLWNSAPNFSTNGHDPTSNQLRTLLGSGSTLNTLFTSSPPPHPSSTDPAMQTHSELNGGTMIKSGDFEDNTGTNLFSFNDCGGHVFSSGFSSGGDLSPTILMHYRNQHQDLHQPLTRRHSDWVVNSSNLLTELSNRGGACGVAAAAAAAAAAGMLLGRNSSSRSSGRIGTMGPGQSAPQQHEMNNNNSNNSPFTNSSGFDLIKALDQLCLSSPSATNGDDQHGQHAPSAVASMPHCPPGFEPLQQQPVSADSVVFTLNSSKEATTDNGTITSLIDPWSTNDSISNSPFLSSHAGAPQREFIIDDGPLSKSSLLRRLFSNPPPSSSDSITVSCSEDPDTAAKVARINAIWSQSVVSNDNVSGTASNEALYTTESLNRADTNGQSMSSRSDRGGLFGGYDLPDLGSTTAVMDHTARCGTIGEGRRRRRPSPSDVDPLALPVTSAIASITEVA
ncbi:unnamed protein product [Calicophoron daubneyi]|uniref:K Homology domain-containing protein n=1 Tax=Calicophoron daubneyi TaxID=300641 RepID=A0AAV2T5F6_CALDB